MFKFLVKVVQGKITPVLPSKTKQLDRILQHYQDSGKRFVITIEEQEKVLSTEQIKLYNAFFIKASNEYGCTFQEMEVLLKRFMPIDESNGEVLLKSKWTTNQLNDFINQASALLSEQGFNF